jgi:hypothetical protein
MCDQLATLGFSLGRINNGAPARRKDTFANVDAERWFAFRRLVEKREIILPRDGELLKQLCSRRLQYDAKPGFSWSRRNSCELAGFPRPIVRTRSLERPQPPCLGSQER